MRIIQRPTGTLLQDVGGSRMRSYMVREIPRRIRFSCEIAEEPLDHIEPEIAGDVAMLADEVTPVLKALRANGLDVVAIHNHMIGGEPAVYFLHYWGTGPAEKLATGFKAALGELGKKTSAHAGD